VWHGHQVSLAVGACLYLVLLWFGLWFLRLHAFWWSFDTWAVFVFLQMHRHTFPVQEKYLRACMHACFSALLLALMQYNAAKLQKCHS
jgi:hypothetical protein